MGLFHLLVGFIIDIMELGQFGLHDILQCGSTFIHIQEGFIDETKSFLQCPYSLIYLSIQFTKSQNLFIHFFHCILVISQQGLGFGNPIFYQLQIVPML